MSNSFYLKDSLLNVMKVSHLYSSTIKSDSLDDDGILGTFDADTMDGNDDRIDAKASELFVTSMDFSMDGLHLITTQSSSTLNEKQYGQCLAIYSTDSGKCTQEIPSQKYGCDVVRFTHTSQLVVFASNNNYDHTVRQLDIQNNRFTRYFKGHQHHVLQIAMNPKSNTFCTASKDQSIRFWDVNDPSCIGKIPNVKGYPAVAYDPKGFVLAVSGPFNTIRLYDVRQFSSGPFDSFIVDTSPTNFTNMEFSPDGKYIAVSSQNGTAIVLNAFYGSKLLEIDSLHSAPGANSGTTDQTQSTGTSSQNPSHSDIPLSNTPLNLTFTPDSHYLLMGSKYDANIHAWDMQYIDSGKVNEVTMQGAYTQIAYPTSSPVHTVLWCPKKVMMASASGEHLSLWNPDVDANLYQDLK